MVSIIRVVALCIALFAVLSVAAESSESVRGVWVTAWTPGLRTPEEIDATLDAAQKAGINTLFWQVRKTGDAYYSSSIEPLGDGVPPGFDPLAYGIKEAHRRHMKLHAWVNMLRVWKIEKLPSDPKHLVLSKPEWLSCDFSGKTVSADGMFLDPGIPEVRAYLVRLIADISKRYSIDGIHLDFIRYPGTEWGYSNLALKYYAQDTGQTDRPQPTDARFAKWRRDRVTLLVKAIKSVVKKPVTVAAVCWGQNQTNFSNSSAYTRAFQDWSSWCSSGLIDAVVPMCYLKEGDKRYAAWFREWVSAFTTHASGKPVYVGVAAYLNTPQQTIAQMKVVSQAGHGGFVLFSFNQSPQRDALVEALAGKR